MRQTCYVIAKLRISLELLCKKTNYGSETFKYNSFRVIFGETYQKVKYFLDNSILYT